MTDVLFYHLERSRPEEVLPTLLEKTLKRGWRALVKLPTPEALETFLARIPMIFSIAILSPHGYFGQANVLGKPDTGGQVVYILDQVRALEREMRAALKEGPG